MHHKCVAMWLRHAPRQTLIQIGKRRSSGARPARVTQLLASIRPIDALVPRWVFLCLGLSHLQAREKRATSDGAARGMVLSTGSGALEILEGRVSDSVRLL
jgi:hypothetical protein